ncbi:hypothetical protein DYB25_003667 [Aphanomyces astaci]|uniref:TLC domain-containing protein n=1 Tax=Aphanomyces astaci TaxID=112090 RepID=A0A397FTT5_APHAT|nr:hypothetical protein DYB36_006119 [Aphanomyces astaci]RHY20086.1 hypothetical protein DYB25_003667 [Aphanomyces astaci]RHY34007.1 hypothetical protein DYB34_004560 [Aphanomyces astaci]RHY37889.1 hypothetical protein DYB38_004711 [Aphanomyces astaci]RHY71931.1 hypothetical protein DYB30_000548 [Aphanomyces astaci]
MAVTATSATPSEAPTTKKPLPQSKKVPKPNAFLDGLLCSLVAIECVVIYSVLPQHLLAMFGGMLVVVAVAVWATKASFRVVGGFVSRHFLKHLGDPLRKEVTMRKFTDQSWQLMIHGSMSAIWVYTAFSCKFLEEVRKDYLIMMSHHVVTIALVAWSFAVGFLPVGVLVLFLHDASDVPLDLLKMANYLKLEDRKGFFLSEVLFAVMLTVWVYFRVYLFPSKLIYTAFWENREACCLPHEAHDLSIIFPSPGPPSWLAFSLLLSCLYVLHIWWTFLILRLLKGVLTKSVHDVAEDEYEGASDSGKDD